MRKLGIKKLSDLLRSVNEAAWSWMPTQASVWLRHLSWVVLGDPSVGPLSELTVWLTRGPKWMRFMVMAGDGNSLLSTASWCAEGIWILPLTEGVSTWGGSQTCPWGLAVLSRDLSLQAPGCLLHQPWCFQPLTQLSPFGPVNASQL